MAILKKNQDGTLPAAPANEGILSKIIDTFKVPFMDEDEVLDSSGAFWAVTTAGATSAVASSMVTRKRAEEGKKPFMGILG